MANVSIARRYARALIDVVGADTDAVLEQLLAFARLQEQSRELRDVFTNPVYSRAMRASLLENVLTHVRPHPVLGNLLRLLVQRDRIQFLPDIARLYRDQADLRAGRVRGRVTSATPLSADALGRLEQSLERLTQRDVVIESHVDPKLLGGISAQVGSTVYDGSLRTQLEGMRRALTR